MVEYIERNEVLLHEHRMIAEDGSYHMAVLSSDIRNIPAVDVVPVVHGKWLPYKTQSDTRQVGWICSNCYGVNDDLSNGDTDYCPYCGAIMDLEG